MTRCLTLFLGILLAIAPVWVRAEPRIPGSSPGQAQSGVTDTAQLGEITVEADAEDTSAQAPSSYTTVIRPDALHAKFRDIAELVSHTVGVTVRETGGLGQFSSMSIRGSTSEQVAVYLDGMRLNTGASGTVDLSTIPIDTIDRIEVIRGGGSAQFGQDAIGGVLNIITKHGRKGTQVQAYAGGGYFQTIKAGGSLAHQGKKRSGLISINHFMTKGNYPFQASSTTLAGGPTGVGGETFTRIQNRSLSDSIIVKGDSYFGDHWFVQAANNFFWTTRQMPGTEEQTTLLYPTIPLTAQDRYWRNLANVQATCSDCGTQGFMIQPGINLQNEWNHFRYPTPPQGSPIDFTTHYIALNPNVAFSYLWQAAGDHTTSLRTDYRREHQTQSVGNSTTVAMAPATRNVGSVMIQDEWHSFREKLLINPVVRYEAATQFTHNTALKLGTSIKPYPWITFKANIETAYRLPNFNELYLPDEGFFRGNPSLDKEKSLNWDAGVTLQNTWGRIEGVFYQNRVENSILFVPISALTIQPINTFAVRIHGIEASGRVRFLKLFLVEGNYTWTHAHFVSTGNQLPGRPEQQGNIHVAMDKKWSDRWKLSLFSDIQIMSRFPVNTQNTVFIPSHSQLDAGASFVFLKNWTVTVEGKDLTNVQIYDARAFPLPRRSVFATLKYDWEKT